MSESSNKPNTTGHVWDDNLEEFNNPLPGWWLWTFYLTIIFAVIYWILYPSWPVGGSFLKGINTIQYVDKDGQTKTSSWNTRALLAEEMNHYVEKQKPYFEKVLNTPFAQIKDHPDLKEFVMSAGKSLFGDNCAPCHQSGGGGKVGLAPSLVDDDWLYGGSYDTIQQSITNGRHGVMPAHAGRLSAEQMGDLANYVLSLSGQPNDAALAQKGDALFHGEGGCLACHGADGKGNQMIGCPNLTDNIWLWINMKDLPDQAAKVAAIQNVIAGGMNKGVMPAWGGRLSPEQIKVLTVYVHDDLGGGQ